MIKRLMRLLTRKGYLVEEQGLIIYLADPDPENFTAQGECGTTKAVRAHKGIGQRAISLCRAAR